MPEATPNDKIESLFKQNNNLARRVETLENKVKAQDKAISDILKVMTGTYVGD